MQAENRQFVASDGYVLHYRHWRPEGQHPIGSVVALHGIQSHSGWYEYSSQRLSQAGLEVYFLDRRGSGLNRPSRGDAPHYQRLVNDVIQFLADLRWRREGAASTTPIVLLGVSWGGKLAVVTAARRPDLVDALALLYPGLCPRIGPSWFQRCQLRVAELFGIRGKYVAIPLDDAALFTAEPDWQDFIRQDPLSLKQVTVSFLVANRELGRLALQTPEAIHCPVLLMLAGKDRIIDNAATKRYFDRLVSKRRTLIEYPYAQHTLEFEPSRHEIISELVNWVHSVLPCATIVK